MLDLYIKAVFLFQISYRIIILLDKHFYWLALVGPNFPRFGVDDVTFSESLRPEAATTVTVADMGRVFFFFFFFLIDWDGLSPPLLDVLPSCLADADCLRGGCWDCGLDPPPPLLLPSLGLFLSWENCLTVFLTLFILSQFFPLFEDLLLPLAPWLDVLPCLVDLLFPAGDGSDTVIAFWLFIFRTALGVSKLFRGDVSFERAALLLCGEMWLRPRMIQILLY